MTTTTTTTTTTTIPDTTPVDAATALVRGQAAMAKLNASLAKSSLDDFLKAGTRRSVLLVDASDSMASRVRSGARRIDRLRAVVADLRETHPVPIVAFGVRRAVNQVEVVDSVPEPSGSTPLDAGIAFSHQQGATHIVLVTDGEPNNEREAYEAAAQFGGPIDVFYIGDGNDRGSRFAAELARRTGGTAHLTDLAEAGQKQLVGSIRGLLGDGSAL